MIAPPMCTCTACGRIPVHLHTRPPAVPIGLISRLRIDQIFLPNARGWKRIQKARRSVRPLRNRRVELISQPIFERPVRIDFPCVLDVGVHIIPVDRRRPNVRAIRCIGRRHRDRVCVRIPEQQTAQSVWQRLARLNIMLSARRRNEHGRINRPTAKIVLAIGTDTEICRVPVKACFRTPLHRVSRCRPGKIQLSLEQIPEC